MAESRAMGKFAGWCVVMVVLAVARHADAVAMVTGNVFCDQCRDGHLTFFDLPINGAKVGIDCEGQAAITATTDLIGNFMVKLDGTPDLSGCSAKILESPANSDCNIVGSPAKPLSLTWRLFDMEFYSVGSLFFFPAKTMSLCGNTPIVHPPTDGIISSPPPAGIISLPPPPAPAAVVTLPPPPPAPAAVVTLPPPPPRGGIITLPPLPFLQASACSYDFWVKKEYMCHWRFVGPETKVRFVFGEEAGKKYGQELSLWQGLQGRGDVYRTLLREAIASLLNSYNTLSFRYNSVSVVMHMHWALHAGSPGYVAREALSFKKANLGLGGGAGGKGNAKCMLKPCK